MGLSTCGNFNLPSVNGTVRITLWSGEDVFTTFYTMEVNGRELQASKGPIKKLYKYMYKIIDERDREKDTTSIEADLMDPDFAHDMFDSLNDE